MGPLECNGIMPAYVKTTEFYQEFNVHYEIREDAVLTYTYLPQVEPIIANRDIFAVSGK